jgi:hypothetical protein
VAHVHVALQVDVLARAARAEAIDLRRELQHVRAVLGEVQVGAANAARADPDEHLALPRLWLRHVLPHQNLSATEHNRTHLQTNSNRCEAAGT